MYRQTLLILCPILVFLFLFIQPRQSLSSEEAPAADVITGKISDQSSGDTLIGEIRTKDKVLIIRSGEGVRHYTVKSKDGDILADDINTGELEIRFPELNDVVENGFAGDASLRMDNVPDEKVPVKIEINR
ncbi:MAG: hypothetical protein JW944_02735 [Deltaproteobacteria bacterium]|nr:hypothetical protein [Deltaproteobacteria bacterium]